MRTYNPTPAIFRGFGIPVPQNQLSPYELPMSYEVLAPILTIYLDAAIRRGAVEAVEPEVKGLKGFIKRQAKKVKKLWKHIF